MGIRSDGRRVVARVGAACASLGLAAFLASATPALQPRAAMAAPFGLSLFGQGADEASDASTLSAFGGLQVGLPSDTVDVARVGQGEAYRVETSRGSVELAFERYELTEEDAQVIALVNGEGEQAEQARAVYAASLEGETLGAVAQTGGDAAFYVIAKKTDAAALAYFVVEDGEYEYYVRMAVSLPAQPQTLELLDELAAGVSFAAPGAASQGGSQDGSRDQVPSRAWADSLTLGTGCLHYAAGSDASFELGGLPAQAEGWSATLVWDDGSGNEASAPMVWTGSGFRGQVSHDGAGQLSVRARLTDGQAVVESDAVGVTFYAQLCDMLVGLAMDCVVDEVDISAFHLTEEQYQQQRQLVLRDPRYMHTNGSTYWHRTEGGVTYVTSVQLKYRLSGEELAEYPRNLEASLQALVGQIDPAWSDLDKLAYLHDWLCLNVSYDNDVVDPEVSQTVSRTPLGALMYGKGVCSAYTSAFQLACWRLEIPCEYVSSDEMNHAWNMVCLDGQWYHVDVTWDDRDTASDDEVSRLHFLVGDATLSYSHSGWASDHAAPQDHPYSGVLHYGPQVASFDQIIGWVRDAGYFGEVDVVGYRMTPDEFNYEARRLCDNLGIAASWTWWTDSDTGLVTMFRFNS